MLNFSTILFFLTLRIDIIKGACKFFLISDIFRYNSFQLLFSFHYFKKYFHTYVFSAYFFNTNTFICGEIDALLLVSNMIHALEA